MSYIETLKDPSQACVFCAKLDCDDRAEFVLRRGETCYAALNVFPYNNGHILIVPHSHVTTIEDVPCDCLLEMMTLCQQALAALRLGYQPRGFNVGFNLGAAAGAGLPDHLHMHVVPRWTGDSTFMSVVGNTRVLPESLMKAGSGCALCGIKNSPCPRGHLPGNSLTSRVDRTSFIALVQAQPFRSGVEP